jgi:hypothetical protein
MRQSFSYAAINIGRPKMKETVIPEYHCPACGRELNATTDPFSDYTPKPGNYTICIYCTHIMIFGKDLSVRELTKEEAAKIKSDHEVMSLRHQLQKALGILDIQ